MLQQVLATPENGIYGTIAFVLMFGNFLAIIWWVMTRKKETLEELGRIPLTDEPGRAVVLEGQNIDLGRRES